MSRWNPLAVRKERRLVAAEHLRAVRRMVGEDLTALGEQIAELSVGPGDGPDDHRVDHRDHDQALGLYERARPALDDAASLEEVVEVEKALVEARFLLARIAARRAGEELPRRRAECFFNPQHGPAATDVRWTPPGGTEREIAVCMRDRDRLVEDQEPDIRLVRVGYRWVPWHEAPSGGIADLARFSHAVRGDAMTSRAFRADAETRAGLDRAAGGLSN